MADKEQLDRLKNGVTAWNQWRTESITPIDLTDADLQAAELAGADLNRADLTNADLTGADLTSADLILADLTNANLTGAELANTDLFNADLQNAHLTDANLSAAILAFANLTFADLSRAMLSSVNLSNANLTNALLTSADLSNANLTGAELIGADLLNARLDDTVFADVDLRTCSGLSACDHRGPSTIDHRTLLRSGITIPLSFLRGCGLPDKLIDYLPSLLETHPIQVYGCFISYSTSNQDFADRLHADLQARGVRCWFAPHDMRPGQEIEEQIDRAIRVSSRLLLILSRESMASSWVITEIEKARAKEIALKRHVLFPLALVPFSEIRAWKHFDPDLVEDIAKRIRRFHIPDFSKWKTDHNAYQLSLESVVKALNTSD